MYITLMVLVVDIQSEDPKEFDYATYIVNQMNHSFEKIKGDSRQIVFPYYSLLMYMLLFVGDMNSMGAGICQEMCLISMARRSLFNSGCPSGIQGMQIASTTVLRTCL